MGPDYSGGEGLVIWNKPDRQADLLRGVSLYAYEFCMFPLPSRVIWSLKRVVLTGLFEGAVPAVAWTATDSI